MSVPPIPSEGSAAASEGLNPRAPEGQRKGLGAEGTVYIEHDHHELEHAAMQCLNSPRHCRPPASFGITKAHAEWAKVKGAVKMAAIMHHKGA